VKREVEHLLRDTTTLPRRDGPHTNVRFSRSRLPFFCPTPDLILFFCWPSCFNAPKLKDWQ